MLVGLDGSEHSLAALSVADDLAGRLGSEVHVLAATGGKPIGSEGSWTERVSEWDRGHPVSALRDRSSRADLVVIGSRGLHGVRALGSVSERVAHRSHCSTLVVQLYLLNYQRNSVSDLRAGEARASLATARPPQAAARSVVAT